MSLYKGTVPIAGLAKNTIVNGFHIFDCKWADHLLEDISWLRADTFSWQSGSVYVTAYNELVSEYNNASSTTETEGSITFKRTPKGYKIADATQETAILNKYNTDGIAWYYILDTANTRFKLPRCKYKYWKNFSNNTLPVKGNGISVGLTNGTGNLYGLAEGTTPSGLAGTVPAYGASVSGSPTYSTSQAYGYLGITTDSSKSGIVVDTTNTIEETGFYLYFYVGEYTQTAIEQTAGITSEQLNAKVDVASLSTINPMITSYVNGTSGYNIWANGYCEQWGVINATGGGVDISLTKTFKDTNYSILTGTTHNSDATAIYSYAIITTTKTVNSFRVYGTNSNYGCYWKACGYLAEGQY